MERFKRADMPVEDCDGVSCHLEIALKDIDNEHTGANAF